MEGNARETYPLRVTRKVRVHMDPELEPPQPDTIADAVASLLEAEERPAPDPWWAEGVREALDS